MTAVEWLEMEIVKLEKDYAIPGKLYELSEQAKEIEKQQIIDIFDDGCQWGYERQPYNAEQYYNEKFKK